MYHELSVSVTVFCLAAISHCANRSTEAIHFGQVNSFFDEFHIKGTMAFFEQFAPLSVNNTQLVKFDFFIDTVNT